MGIFSTCLYGGLGIGPFITGRIISDARFDLGFGSAAIIIGLGALIFYIIAKKNDIK